MIDHDAHRFLMRVFVLLLIFFGKQVAGQVPLGARNLGIGNASVALTGILSLESNAAGIASLGTPAVSFIYGEHFYPSDTRSFAGRVAVPLGFATLGAQVHHYSFNP